MATAAPGGETEPPGDRRIRGGRQWPEAIGPGRNTDPLWFGILVAVNLQTAFLSPPVAMAAFYLKGVSPPHVTLAEIYWGMMPFMALQLVGLVIVYFFPQLAMWLPRVVFGG